MPSEVHYMMPSYKTPCGLLEGALFAHTKIRSKVTCAQCKSVLNGRA